MDDNVINLKLNEDGVYDITDDIDDNDSVDDSVDDIEDIDFHNEFQQHTPIDDFVNGIFMGLNVSGNIHKLIRKVL